MTTNQNKKEWNYRLKTSDNAYISELLHNFGLSGGLSVKDLPYIPLTGLAAMGVIPKIKELREKHLQKKENGPQTDTKRVNDFQGDMSTIRNVLERAKAEKETRHHPSVPGFEPFETYREPFDVERMPYDVEIEGRDPSPKPTTNIFDIRDGRPIFNAVDQGKPQKGRPFERDEE